MTARKGFLAFVLTFVRNDFARREQRGLQGFCKAGQLNAFVIFCDPIAVTEMVEYGHRRLYFLAYKEN